MTWTVSQYDLEDRERIVFATVTYYDNHPERDEGDWFLAISAGRLDVEDLRSTWWPTAEAAMQAVDERSKTMGAMA